MPNVAEAAPARIQKERAAAHARLEAVYADYRAAEARFGDAADAEWDALAAICEHRCASFEELAEKARFLRRHCEPNELTEQQYDALLASLLPGGEIVEEGTSSGREPSPNVSHGRRGDSAALFLLGEHRKSIVTSRFHGTFSSAAG